MGELLKIFSNLLSSSLAKMSSAANQIEEAIKSVIDLTNEKRQSHSAHLASFESEMMKKAEEIMQSSKLTFEKAIETNSELLKTKIEQIFSEVESIRSLEDQIFKLQDRMKKAYELMFCEE